MQSQQPARPRYHVYRARYEVAERRRTVNGDLMIYDVTMVRVRELEATGAADAMVETKRLGHIAPMVGL